MKRMKRYLVLLTTLCALILCGAFAVAAETDGIFTYTVSGDQATVTAVDFAGQTEIHIPETLGGYTVTGIGSQALTDRTWNLGDDTVETLYIPKTITTINNNAFSYADLAKIVVEEDNPSYSSDAHGVLFNKDKTTLIKAAPCFAEESYAVPEGVTTLNTYAFEGVLFLPELTLPSTLTAFGQQAFSEMQSLKSIALPEGITAIGQNDFAYCASLTSVSLPSSLRTIAASAFTECGALKEVMIPEGVTSIGRYAFESDAALERIVLPASLQSIQQAICGNCPNLAHVYYAGSAEDWAALNVRTGSYFGTRVDAFDVATFHYNFDAAPYETLTVDYDNDLLTISGSGNIPAAGADTFQFWDEHRDTVTALFFTGEISSVGAGAFTDFPNLSYVILETDGTTLSADAFSACPALETLLFFGDAGLDDAAVDTDVEFLQVFVPQGTTISGDFDPAWYHVVPFNYADQTLTLNGNVIWDSYQFLDTMTAFCLRYDPIDVLKCSDFTLNALPLYGTNKDGDYEQIKGNRLTDAELRAQVGDADSMSFNELVRGIIDGEITSFRLIAKDSEHEEIKDTPVEIKEEQKEEGGIIGTIKKAIKWVVRLLDSLLNIISKLRGK